MGGMKGSVRITGRSVSKGELCHKLEADTGVASRDCGKFLKGLEEIIPTLLQKSAKVNLPGIFRFVVKRKKATRAMKRMMFGEMRKIKAMKARNVVKAFPAKALKDQF